MKVATLAEIKKTLADKDHTELVEICLKLSRYKKENKELLNYLLFESQDEVSFINAIKEELIEEFNMLAPANLYLYKKSLRRILRSLNRNIKYSGKKTTEIELLIHFCSLMKKFKLNFQNTPVLLNLYNQQIKKILKAMSTLHEDLQYDYMQELESLIIK